MHCPPTSSYFFPQICGIFPRIPRHPDRILPASQALRRPRPLPRDVEPFLLAGAADGKDPLCFFSLGAGDHPGGYSRSGSADGSNGDKHAEGKVSQCGLGTTTATHEGKKTVSLVLSVYSWSI